MVLVGHAPRMGYVIVYKIIQIKSEGKEQIGRPDVDGRFIF
jgi:hypothetical protein